MGGYILILLSSRGTTSTKHSSSSMGREASGPEVAGLSGLGPGGRCAWLARFELSVSPLSDSRVEALPIQTLGLECPEPQESSNYGGTRASAQVM